MGGLETQAVPSQVLFLRTLLLSVKEIVGVQQLIEQIDYTK